MVPEDPDRLTVPIALSCDLAGVSRQLRSTWLDRRLVTGSKTGASTKRQTIELAAFRLLNATLGFEDARLAWVQAQDQILDNYELAPELAMDLERKTGTVCMTDEDLATA